MVLWPSLALFWWANWTRVSWCLGKNCLEAMHGKCLSQTKCSALHADPQLGCVFERRRHTLKCNCRDSRSIQRNSALEAIEIFNPKKEQAAISKTSSRNCRESLQGLLHRVHLTRQLSEPFYWTEFNNICCSKLRHGLTQLTIYRIIYVAPLREEALGLLG